MATKLTLKQRIAEKQNEEAAATGSKLTTGVSVPATFVATSQLQKYHSLYAGFNFQFSDGSIAVFTGNTYWAKTETEQAELLAASKQLHSAITLEV